MHSYNIRIKDDDINRLMEELSMPWTHPKVLKHLHYEMDLNLAQIGEIFNVSRQAIQQSAKELDISVERKGRSEYPKQNQQLLTDFEEQMTLADLKAR